MFQMQMMLAALMSKIGGVARRKRRNFLSRWDWRRGATPKHGSRRWRAREAYRQSIHGDPAKWPTLTLKEYIEKLEAEQAGIAGLIPF